MPSLIDIRRRIRSVENTGQITKAMKMVSAAKLRRAQARVLGARPYATLLRETLESVLASLPEDSPVREHPLLARREEKNSIVVLISGDRGLCGAFNSNVIRAAGDFLADRDSAHCELELIGRKGRDYFRRRKAPIAGEWIEVLRDLTYESVQEIGAKLIRRFTDAEVDTVFLVYNEFKNVMVQRVVVERLLPVEIPPLEDSSSADYIFEQRPERIFRSLLPKHVEVKLYQAALESAAAEHAARMTAMGAATKNAEEMLEKLILNRNRARQASITTEIIEIVSGAAALE